MGERVSRWGIGPKITRSAVAYAIVAGTLTYLFPDYCLVQPMRHIAAVSVALVLVALGVLMWLTGVVCVMRAYNRDQLVTSGAFALVRHPVYSAWIVLLLPGLALLSRSWPLLLTPLVAYAVFKRLVHREDEYLIKRFGNAYLQYRSRVNEIVPLPHIWRA